MIDIKCGDCLELMKDIPDKSIDMILCDLPYGTTRLEWDKPIPFKPLWEQYNRIIKDNGAILLFSAQPFTTDLINSNRKMFRYEIIWEKTMRTGFYNAKKMPLKIHENILVFYKHLPTYNPQKYQLSQEYISKNLVPIGKKRKNSSFAITSGKFVGTVSKEAFESYSYTDTGERYPTDVIKFSNWNGSLFGNNSKAVKHPTQKPLPLLEYLIKTYSNEGDVVLDNCMGVGTTGIACKNLGRNFIGFELNEGYFEIAKNQLLNGEGQLWQTKHTRRQNKVGYLSEIREHINKLSEDDRQRFIKDYIKKMRIARKIAKDITENGGQSTQTNR